MVVWFLHTHTCTYYSSTYRTYSVVVARCVSCEYKYSVILCFEVCTAYVIYGPSATFYIIHSCEVESITEPSPPFRLCLAAVILHRDELTGMILGEVLRLLNYCCHTPVLCTEDRLSFEECTKYTLLLTAVCTKVHHHLLTKPRTNRRESGNIIGFRSQKENREQCLEYSRECPAYCCSLSKKS